MINNFKGRYSFLNTFSESNFYYDGLLFHNAECAFQSAKCRFEKDKRMFCHMSPREAKNVGNRVSLRPGWDNMKYQIMKDINYCKFSQNPDLKRKLLKTGNEYLEFANNHGNSEWGTINGVGRNWLGKILMEIREELKEDA